MKRFIPVLALVAILAVAAISQLTAYVSPQVRLAGENICFNRISTQASHTASTTASIGWTTMVPATVLPPYRVEIQNQGANPLVYGLGTPTSASSYLAASATLTLIFNQAPPEFNVRSLTGASAYTVTVWKE